MSKLKDIAWKTRIYKYYLSILIFPSFILTFLFIMISELIISQIQCLFNNYNEYQHNYI